MNQDEIYKLVRKIERLLKESGAETISNYIDHSPREGKRKIGIFFEVSDK